jgi:hypothetical protein
MPVLLTTPYNPGDRDPGNTYPRAKLQTFMWVERHDGGEKRESINVTIEYGDLDEGQAGTWIPGAATPIQRFSVTGSDYDAMVAEVATTEEGYAIYAGAKRVLYQWLIDNGHLVGTIE